METLALIGLGIAGVAALGYLTGRISIRGVKGLTADLEASQEQLRRMAITDGLTAIWNYRYFQLQFDREIERAHRFGRPFSLIIIDVDDFKTFNDTHGHQTGDFVLIELARRVKEIIRDIDIFARYGGEEFVVLLPETDAEGGKSTAERVRAVISDEPFEGEMAPEPLKVTVSVGIAGFPDAGKTKTEIFQAADKAMFKAKSLGKNQVVVHQEAASDENGAT